MRKIKLRNNVVPDLKRVYRGQRYADRFFCQDEVIWNIVLTGHNDHVSKGAFSVFIQVIVLLYSGMHISEFWGLTLSDLDMENRISRIDHQLQRTSAMECVIESTQTNAGTRKIPMTEGVYRCFQAIIEDREAPRFEQMIDGHTGFLYLDNRGMPEVAMHWEHRFNHAVNRYNDIYKVQMPNITPHVCRHTYCSNQAKAGMNPKTLQYLMGHSDIGVTMNVYTHLGLEDAAAEMARMEAVEAARKEQEKITGEKDRENTITQKMFRVV